MRIKYSKKFALQYKSAGKKIKQTFEETLELFLEYPHHKALRRHFLKKEYTGYQSIDITSDYRAIFKETGKGKATIIIFHFLGTHKELYGK